MLIHLSTLILLSHMTICIYSSHFFLRQQLSNENQKVVFPSVAEDKSITQFSSTPTNEASMPLHFVGAEPTRKELPKFPEKTGKM